MLKQIDSSQSSPQINRAGLLLFVIGYLAVSIFFLAIGAQDWLTFWRLQADGIAADGIVIDRREGHTKSPHYFVQYQFEASLPDGTNQTFVHDREVTRRLFDLLPGGTETAVIYLPQNPQISNIAANDPRDIPNSNMGFSWIGVWGIGLFLLFGGLVIGQRMVNTLFPGKQDP